MIEKMLLHSLRFFAGIENEISVDRKVGIQSGNYPLLVPLANLASDYLAR